MNEIWVHIGVTNNAARLELKSVSGRSGLGVMQVCFRFEASCRNDASAQRPMWFEGKLSALGLGSSSGYLGRLVVESSPVTLHSLAATTTFDLVVDLDHRQLQIIEEHRTGALKFNVEVTGTAMRDGNLERIGVGSIECDVNQSNWAAILEQMQYRRLLLVELDAPDVTRSAEFAAALDYYRDAENQYIKHEWRLTVEALRQTLAALVGKKADDEDEAAGVTAAAKALRKESVITTMGYAPRTEQVRLALKFMCDLGAHPEVAGTEKRNAYSALLMVGGLLHSWEPVKPRITAQASAEKGATSQTAPAVTG
ncbi:hypothetical protein [Streptomyces sp. SPB4]|uniref:hypothetical protein n=1 Tax=Streptomyces sp. SPB4 TaxID=2940553 RepID=UPI002474B5C4|nr:hypothetical protein [Streptomyces sp. SPB4]MDH6538062.1 hypothetical protein [Streptomyces sp. SPB4]